MTDDHQGGLVTDLLRNLSIFTLNALCLELRLGHILKGFLVGRRQLNRRRFTKQGVENPTARLAPEKIIIQKSVPQQVDPDPGSKEKLNRKTYLLQEKPLPTHKSIM